VSTKTYNNDPRTHFLSSSFAVEGNLNYRRLKAKERYKKWIIGEARRDELGHELRGDHVISASFFSDFSGSYFGDEFSRPPSWTRSEQGSNQSFVQRPISSSAHEITNLNLFNNGITALETTQIPASGTEYYSKKSSLVTKTYFLTASADLSGTSQGIGHYSAVSGNLFTSSLQTPAIFSINIPDYGKIQNIRVWVEIIASTNGDAGSFDFQSTYGKTYLALKSPNVTGFASYPFINALGDIHDLKIHAEHMQFPFSGPFSGSVGPSQMIFDSFILSSPPTFFTQPWSLDTCIRTVYDDASDQRHSSHMDPMFASGSDSFQRHLRREASPSVVFSGSILGYDIGSGWTFSDTELGNGIPWITDPRVINDIAIFNSSSAIIGSSPPEGWLTGPGGTAAVNEFDTTGSNLGPPTMKPLYPLLDEVGETLEDVVIAEGQEPRTIVGSRPGLRGSEIHGQWDLLAVSAPFYWHDFPNYLYFRQFRLEITYEENRDYQSSKAFISNRSKSSINFKPGTRHNNTIMSASFLTELIFPVYGLKARLFQLQTGTVKHFIVAPDNPGHTYGITSDTGSLQDYAVFTRVTGTLADRLTSSLGFHNDFLNNEFGTPYIPLSSGSGESPSFDIFSDATNNAQFIEDVLSPKPLVGRALTLRSVLASKNTTVTTRDLATKNAEDEDNS
jgi:hypothetical protein